MYNLFAYGTLMSPDILQEVTGCVPPYLTGTLTGYSRRQVKDEVYPALIADENGTVEGILYFDVPEGAWVRLDRFEDEIYSREHVEVRLSPETVLPAMVYVTRPECLDCVDGKEWDYKGFLEKHKDSFLSALSWE